MNMIALITAAAFLVQPGEAPKAKAPPGTPRVLVMKDLSRRPVRLLAVGAEQVQVSTVRGTRSRTSSVPRRDVLAVLADDAAAAPATSGEAWLRTTGGEVLAGRLAPPEKPGAETLVWRTARLGDLTLKLDEVKRLDFLPVAGEPGPGRPGEDRVLLSNGERFFWPDRGLDSGSLFVSRQARHRCARRSAFRSADGGCRNHVGHPLCG